MHSSDRCIQLILQRKLRAHYNQQKNQNFLLKDLKQNHIVEYIVHGKHWSKLSITSSGAAMEGVAGLGADEDAVEWGCVCEEEAIDWVEIKRHF